MAHYDCELRLVRGHRDGRVVFRDGARRGTALIGGMVMFKLLYDAVALGQ